MTAVETAEEKTKTVTIIVNTKPHTWAEKKIYLRAGGRARVPGSAIRSAGHHR